MYVIPVAVAVLFLVSAGATLLKPHLLDRPVSGLFFAYLTMMYSTSAGLAPMLTVSSTMLLLDGHALKYL